MKKLLLVATFSMASFLLSAQNDVTQFMGIPIDGFKHEMIQKLKEKGFVLSSLDSSFLEGEFNGEEVLVNVQTNNNKVWRIAVVDVKARDEGQIKIRYNNLCRQFEENSRYKCFEDQTIPEEEDISYEMLVNDKQYQAAFYQKQDSVIKANYIRSLLLSKYSEEQLENPTTEILSEELSESIKYTIQNEKLVWFTIINSGRGYSITMFYENKSNKANGEDL